MGDKTKERFIGLFRAFGSVEGELPAGAANTIMPWPAYNNLSDDDLGIIYDYIKAQKPSPALWRSFPSLQKLEPA